MPTSEAPTNVTEPESKGHPANGSKLVSLGLEVARPEPGTEDRLEPTEGGSGAPQPEPQPAGGRSTSRWVDYDTHELLEMIGELEDERRWARLREGLWLAILFHFILLSLVTWIPKYVLHIAPVIDPIQAIKDRKDLTYLDLPPDALRKLQPKVTVKPVQPKITPRIDRKTLEALNKPAPPPPEPAPAPQIEQPKLANPVPTPPQPIAPQPQSQLEAPRPQAVPARPNFNLGSPNPADQLQNAMRGASRGATPGEIAGGSGLARHPGAGSGGVEILSDTQGVDFRNWLIRWHRETENTWDPLIPDEVNPPINKTGAVIIRFKVLPNGRLMDGSLVLEGRSGDTGLDRAAWGALTGSNYPPLPSGFHGPYIELRAIFLYNMEPPR